MNKQQKPKGEPLNIRNCPIELKRKLEGVKSERRHVSLEKLVIEALYQVYLPEQTNRPE